MLLALAYQRQLEEEQSEATGASLGRLGAQLSQAKTLIEQLDVAVPIIESPLCANPSVLHLPVATAALIKPTKADGAVPVCHRQRSPPSRLD